MIKGAGDLATGIAWRLKKCGHDIVMTETDVPTTVRRTVAFSRAVYEQKAAVEGIEAEYAGKYGNAQDMDTTIRTLPVRVEEILSMDRIAVITDPEAALLNDFRPEVLIDAIIAKKNTGTSINNAAMVIGVGPGFTAGRDCHCVIETKRGHYLGKVIYTGSAIPDTGVPGDIGGYTVERIIRAEADGIFIPVRQIGERTEKGDLLAKVFVDMNAVDKGEGIPVYAQIPGIIRGMLQEGVVVFKGMKCGDIDPRCEQEHCHTISDKARAIAGGALEAVSRFERRRNSLGIVLLASGEGKRYGANKLLDTVNGKRMFEWVFDSVCDIGNDLHINRGYSGIVVVTAWDEIAGYAGNRHVLTVRNNCPEKGISYSLGLGLKELMRQGYENILFAVCDQPGLTSDSFVKLINGYASSDKGLACLGQGEDRLGNPCIFSKKYFGELARLIGDVGGKRVIMAHREDLVIVNATDGELKDVDFPHLAMNIP